MRRLISCALLLATLEAAVIAQRRPDTYRAAAIDAQQRLVITTSDNRTLIVPLEKDQTGFAEPQISPGGTAVGAVEMFGNCCTAYDIPLKVAVYKAGRMHRFGGAWMVLGWWFKSESELVFGSSTVHFIDPRSK